MPEVGAVVMHSNLYVHCCSVLRLMSVSRSAWPTTQFHCTCLSQAFLPLGCVSLPNLLCYPNQPPSQKWAQILCTQICVFNCTCLSTSIPTPRVCQSAWLVMLSLPAPLPEVGVAAMHSNPDVHCCPVLLPMSVGMSAWLTTQFPCICFSQVFPPLGCVSLPDLSCYPRQSPSQKWVQILCTKICVFSCTCLSTSILPPRVC